MLQLLPIVKQPQFKYSRQTQVRSHMRKTALQPMLGDFDLGLKLLVLTDLRLIILAVDLIL